MRLQILYLAFFYLAVSLTISGQSIGGATSGSTAYCIPSNSGFVSLNGYNGTILHWQSSVNNGQTWTFIPNQTSTQSYLNLPQTTSFRAIVKDGNFIPDTSSVSTITVFIAANAGTITGSGTFCMNSGNGTLISNGISGNIIKWEYTSDGGLNWSPISTTLNTVPYSNITSDIGYRALAENVIGCPIDTSAIAWVKIDQNTMAGSLIHSDSVCINKTNETVILSSRTGTIVDWYRSYDGTTWFNLGKTTDTLFLAPIDKSIFIKTAVKNGVCPTLTTNVAAISVYQVNQASAGEDMSITQYEPVTLKGYGNGTPSWSDDSGFISSELSPVVYPVKPTTYTLVITDSHGCKTRDSVFVNVIIPVPNTISPNNDGINDYFVIDKIETYPTNTLTIFNRWGQRVNTFAPYTNQWNGVSEKGHELPNGIYFYSFDYGNGDKPLTGFIMIKR